MGNQPIYAKLNGEDILTPFNPEGGFFHSGNYLLFPWVNRLDPIPNEWNIPERTQFLGETTGIHGFVYNAPRTLIEKTENCASFFMELLQIELKESFTLGKDFFRTEVTIKNLSSKPFPFSLGYHPYFQIQNWENPEIEFMGESWNWELDNALFPVKNPKKSRIPILSLKEKWDHLFFSPNGLKLSGKGIHSRIIKTNLPFFQIYTPLTLQSVAIEPMLTPGNFLNIEREVPLLTDTPKKYWWEIKIL
jgi:galactose mutarotase-like enzyme